VIKDDLISKIEKLSKLPIIELNKFTLMTNVLRILNGILLPLNRVNKTLGGEKLKQKNFEYIQVVIYAIIWGASGFFEPEDRKILHDFLQNKGYPIPKRTKES